MRRTLLAMTAISVCLAFVSITAPASANQSNQKMYLDPDTGDVTSSPPPEAADNASRIGRAPRSTPPPGPTPWTNADGADMLTLDPQDAPVLEAARCPDGSLRLGHVRASAPTQSKESLCEPVHR